jgi:serine beta-lactamase-like protein LACTB
MMLLDTDRQRLLPPWKTAVGVLLLATILVPTVLSPARGAESDAPQPAGAEVDYGAAVERLGQVVDAELKRELLQGVAIALVDDQRIVSARGYGMADAARGIAADGRSVYRAGSISKLFTAVAAMQLVEQNKLDIDRPVTDYLRDFRILWPFPNAEMFTPRQLMCHRSGLVRESPVGGYLDPKQPSIEATVASLGPCVLAVPPNTKTKYSNVGPTITGLIVQQVAGEPFDRYQRKQVLGPLGMENSSFRLNDAVRERLAPGRMRVADGKGGFRPIRAPLFELGTLPAGNLYTTAEDLARFAKFLLAEGRAGDRQVLKAETLREMFTPQLVGSEATGFGLGFHAGQFHGHKSIGHTGAVYGHTACISVLPEAKLGVVVLTNEDISMGPVRRLTDAALEVMLQAKTGYEPEPVPEPIELSDDGLAAFAGEYESQSYWAHLEADGRFTHRATVSFDRDADGQVTGFDMLDQGFRRVDADAVREVPKAWKKLLGSYGPEFIPLIVSVRNGHLYAMTENMVDYRLTPINRVVFGMPEGMYVDEQLVFQVGPDGKVHSVILANMTLPRRRR